MELQNIKLIIWDLDETFWEGTISEEPVRFVPEHIEFVKNITNIGIVNSICSKNDFLVVKERLESEKMWDYFVFSSINWNPKGQRVKDIIDTMKLRSANVLFVDDNVQNLEEAKHFCPGIITAFPQELSGLIKEAENMEKKDLQHKRLEQYKQLEKKECARTEFSSNDEFLMSCNIRVDVCYDCEKEVERIHELLMRSNQLNYTKFRQDRDDLVRLINDENVNVGYVKVKDKFGDYGIVGFFAEKEGKLIHYAFSCRTLGMKIEQYIYFKLGCPELEVVGDVVTKLNDIENPVWINNKLSENDGFKAKKKTGASKKILLKGPCDMSQMYSFLNFSEGITTEFTYTNDAGISVEGQNHTSQIVTSLYANEKRKQEILADVDFFDKNMLTTALQTEKFDFVVLSMLTDGNLGIYKRKKTGEEIALCEKRYSLTDMKNYNKYLNGEIFTSCIDFTPEKISSFELKYNYVDNDNSEKTVHNLQKILEYIGEETKLILLLGSEREFKKKFNEAYLNRHLEHAEMNRKIEQWAKDKPNVILLPFDKYIKGDSDFIDTINHFVKRVYYDLACELVSIIGNGDGSIDTKGKSVLIMATIKQKLQTIKSKIFSE